MHGSIDHRTKPIVLDMSVKFYEGVVSSQQAAPFKIGDTPGKKTNMVNLETVVKIYI